MKKAKGEYLKRTRIFIASPSDVPEEREMFPEILKEVNEIKAIPNHEIFLEPIGWEKTLPGIGRPQEKINEDLMECDLVVMLLWKRWGTPSGKFSSGFEEEYELACTENKEIFLYFRSVPEDMMANPDEQLRKVLDFRIKIESEKKLLFKQYESKKQWEKELRANLCHWLDRKKPEPLEYTWDIESWNMGGGIGQHEKEPEHFNDKQVKHDHPLLEYKLNIESESRIKQLKQELEQYKDKHKDAYSLIVEAKKLAESGHLTKAEEHFARAETMSPDPITNNEYGKFLVRIGLLGKAQERYEQIIEIGKVTDSLPLMGAGYSNMGIIYEIRGDLDNAENMNNKALEIHTKLGKKDSTAMNYCNLGNIYQIRGDLDKSEAMYDKALKIEIELGRKEGMAANYGNLGNIYHIRGDLDKAENMHNHSLEINKELGSKEGMAINYSNLGNIYQNRGDIDKAEKMHLETLEINKELGKKEGMAADYGNLGNVYNIRRDIDKAEEMFEKSLEIYKELGNKEGTATIYGNLGQIYETRGDIDKAEEMHYRALEINKELGRKEGIATCYSNLGNVYQSSGDIDKAEEMHYRALEINKELGRKEGIAINYSNLSFVYETRGDIDKAEEMLTKALEIFKEIGAKDRIKHIETLIKELNKNNLERG